MSWLVSNTEDEPFIEEIELDSKDQGMSKVLAIEEESRWKCCRLNVILAIVLSLILILISLEIRKTHRDQIPFLSLLDFVDIREHNWKLDTEVAYKLDPNFSSHSRQTRSYKFVVSSIEALPDGVWKNVTVINGQFPGPLIECNSGDELEIEVVNEGVEPTTIHFHGLYQNGTNYYDGSSAVNQCDISPGQKLVYKFTISDDQWGTYWYHSHYSTQYADGLFGPLIIHSSKEDSILKLSNQIYDEEKVVMFNDWYHNKLDSYLLEYLASDNENTEPVPDSALIQGSGVYPCAKTDKRCDDSLSGRHVFQMKPDRRYRLRLINCGFFLEVDFSVDGHIMDVIEGDGTNVETLPLDVLRIAVAQRYSVIINTLQTGLFYMRAKLNSFCFAYENPNLDLDLKLIISISESHIDRPYSVSSTLSLNSTSYGHPNVRCRELNETLLNPVIPEPLPDVDHYFQIDSSFLIKDHAISLGYMNDITYKPLTVSNSLLESIKSTEHIDGVSLQNDFGPSNNQLVLTTNEITTVDILINNYDDGSHPFHLHGYKFWILKHGQGYFKPHRDYDSLECTPMKRDTVNVSGFGYVLLRVVLDNPGVWPFHCHIGWHMEAGLAMQVNVMPQVYREWQLPLEWELLCV